MNKKHPILIGLTTLICVVFSITKTFCQSATPTTCHYETTNTSALAGSNSEYGYGHTPSGNLHILFLFVTFKEDDANLGVDELSHFWPKNNLPIYAGTFNQSSDFIDIDKNSPSTNHNLTNWFKTMSITNANSSPSSKFSVTGKVYHVQISKDTLNIPKGTQTSNDKRLDEIEKEFCRRAIVELQLKYPNEDWTLFDQRENTPEWGFDNSIQNRNGSNASGDGIIDYLNINFRLSQDLIKNYSSRAGYARITLFSDPNRIPLPQISNNSKAWSFEQGHTTIYAMDYNHIFQYFLHEFSHNLYNAPHLMGANSASGQFFYQNNGWGMMGRIERTFLTANAWEKWFLGWSQPQTISESGIYTIKDFVSEGHSIRIRIPHTQYSTTLFDQYLWIENHQLIDYFDNKFMWSKEAPILSGLYMFISAADSKTLINPTTLANNNLKVISAKGNWDFSSDTNEFGVRSFYKGEPNPIGGQNTSQLIRLDYDNDNVIRYAHTEGGNLNEGIEIKKLDGVEKMFGTVTAEDAFQVGDELGLSSPNIVMNYSNFLGSIGPLYSESTIPREYVPNSISIKILSYNPTTHSYQIEVKFDDYSIRKSTRWSGGPITLKNLSGDDSPDLIIEDSSTLTINRTGTPNTGWKHPDGKYPDFFKPSSFKCSSNASILVKNGSKIVASDNVLFSLESGSKLTIESGASIVFKQNSTFKLASTSQVLAIGTGKIVLESGSKLVVSGTPLLSLLDYNSNIELKEGAILVIGGNATFTWTGNGYLKINTGTVGASNIIADGANAKFYKKGSGPQYSQKLIEVIGGGSLSVDKNVSEFKLELGKVVLDDNCLVDIEAKMICHGVKFTSIAPGVKYKGIMVYGQQNTPYLTSSTVENAQWGFICYNNSGSATQASLLNCKFINNTLGVYINGKGADINKCTFWHNNQGAIHLDMMTLTSKLNALTIYNNNNYPVLATGTNYGLVSITNSAIYNNNSTGVYASYTTLGTGCSNISNNFDAIQFAGKNILMAEQSILAQEPALWSNVGNNYLYNAIGDGIIVNNAKRLYLNKGNNHFQVNNGWELYGTLFKQSGTKPPLKHVIADQNYWDVAGNPSINHFQYWIQYEYPSTNKWKDLIITDNTPLTSPPNFSACANGSGTGSFPGTGNGNISAILVGKPTLYLSDNREIQTVFNSALYKLHVEADPINALEDFYAIANYNYNMTVNILDEEDITSEYGIWFEVVLTSYQKMLECLNVGISKNIIGSYSQTPTPYDMIHNTQQNLIARTVNNGDYDYEIAVGLKLDNALLYKLKDQYEECKQQLINLKNQESHTVKNANLIDFAYCNVDKEIQLKNNSIHRTSLPDLLLDCKNNLHLNYSADLPEGGEEPLDPEYNETLTKTHERRTLFNNYEMPKQSNDFDAITIFPNPSNANISIYSAFNKVLNVKAWDMSGKLVMNLDNTTELTFHSKGVYLLTITTSKSTLTRKIFIE